MTNIKHWKDIGIRDRISYAVCILSFLLAGFSFILAIYIPPTGVVDASVLTGIGMFLAFCGSILGISNYYKVKTDELEYKFEQFRSTETTKSTEA